MRASPVHDAIDDLHMPLKRHVIVRIQEESDVCREILVPRSVSPHASEMTVTPGFQIAPFLLLVVNTWMLPLTVSAHPSSAASVISEVSIL